VRRHPTKLPLGGWVPLRAGRYLDQLARYWKKKRKPLDGPEPNRDGTMSHLFREDWRALGSKSGADLVISWSETEPEQVGVFLYYDDEATSDKERWFKLGTPSPTLWEFAKDPGLGTLGRMATPNPGEEQYEEEEFAVGEFYRWTEESPSEYDFEWEGSQLWAFEKSRRGRQWHHGARRGPHRGAPVKGDAPSWVWDPDGEWLMADDAGVDEHAAERRQMGLVDF